MKVLIVHERFTEMGGSEKVTAELVRAFPGASVRVAVARPEGWPPGLEHTEVRTHPVLQRLYLGGGYAHLLPLLPWGMRHTKLTCQGGPPDVVITSHHAFSQRVRPPVGTPFVSYVHTPARWMWDPSMLSGEVGGRWGERALGAFARMQRQADSRAAQRPDRLLANSTAVAHRIGQWWGRESTVVHPPVNTSWFTPDPTVGRDDFFLLAGRLVPYKRPEVAVAAARAAGVRLVVAGDGRARAAAEQQAGPGVEFLGSVTDERLRDLMRRARALVFPGIEDFGIVPVEAMACGTPVIALAKGGVLDSVQDGVTGVLVPLSPGEDQVAAFASVLRDFDDTAFDPVKIRLHAETFSEARFRRQVRDVVLEVVDEANSRGARITSIT